MPYLNWKESSLTQEIGAPDEAGADGFEHHGGPARMRLQLSPRELASLIGQLEGVYEGGGAGSELRLDLPREWTIFWKSRDAESRLLLAHPQPEQWVATVALEPEFGRTALASLRSLAGGQSLSLSTIGDVGSVSNLDLVIAVT